MIEKIDRQDGFKSEESRGFPNIVNVCVLRGPCTCDCRHCPVGSTPRDERIQKFGGEAMSLKTFKKIADEIAQHPHSAMRIHSVGEPLLWKDLKQATYYTSDRKINTWLFTSLVTNDFFMLDHLANNVSVIEVSVNSVDRENYKNTKGIDRFYIVLENIEYLSRKIEKEGLKTRLIVSRVGSDDKEYDERFVRHWKCTGLVADAFIRSYHDYNGMLCGGAGKKKRDPVPCHVHWSRFNIDCDGRAVVCFNELFKGPKPDETLVIGDVKKESIETIWKGEKLNMIRGAQLSGDYRGIDFTKRLPCLDCRFCMPLDSNRTTSEHQINQIKR